MESVFEIETVLREPSATKSVSFGEFLLYVRMLSLTREEDPKAGVCGLIIGTFKTPLTGTKA